MNIEKCINHKTKEISAETEVDFIKTLLERKFNRKFQIRVKVEGYLGENDMKYTLVMDDYCNNNIDKCHSIWGYSTKDILNVRHEFLKSYWDHVEQCMNNDEKQLDSWDARMVESYKRTVVAKSREEFLVNAELEGII